MFLVMGENFFKKTYWRFRIKVVFSAGVVNERSFRSGLVWTTLHFPFSSYSVKVFLVEEYNECQSHMPRELVSFSAAVQSELHIKKTSFVNVLI